MYLAINTTIFSSCNPNSDTTPPSTKRDTCPVEKGVYDHIFKFVFSYVGGLKTAELL